MIVAILVTVIVLTLIVLYIAIGVRALLRRRPRRGTRRSVDFANLTMCDLADFAWGIGSLRLDGIALVVPQVPEAVEVERSTSHEAVDLGTEQGVLLQIAGAARLWRAEGLSDDPGGVGSKALYEALLKLDQIQSTEVSV